jgi:hypothetical protein
MKLFQRLVCLWKGCVGLKRNTKYIRHYIEIPAGRGAFCRDPKRYEYAGRLYRCARCGALHLFRGVCSWELTDLIIATLQDVPTLNWDVALSNQNYKFIRLYG